MEIPTPFIRPAAVGHESSAGFTVIEVIAALAILSLSLAVLFSTLSEGFYNQGKAKTLSEATMIAQSVLARIGTELPLQEGETRGTTQKGYRWTAKVIAYGTVADRQEWPVAAYRVLVLVFVNEGSEDPIITLATVRLAEKA